MKTSSSALLLFSPFVLLSMYLYWYYAHIQVFFLTVYDLGNFTYMLPVIFSLFLFVLKNVFVRLTTTWSKVGKFGSTLVLSSLVGGFSSYYLIPPLLLVYKLSNEFTLYHNGVFSNNLYTNQFWTINRTILSPDIQEALEKAFAPYKSMEHKLIKEQVNNLLLDSRFSEATVLFQDFISSSLLTPQPSFYQLYGSDILLGVGIGLLCISLGLGGFYYCTTVVVTTSVVKALPVVKPAMVSVNMPLKFDQTLISWGGVDGNHLIRVLENYFTTELAKKDPEILKKLTVGAYEQATYQGLQPLLHDFIARHHEMTELTPLGRAFAMRKLLVKLEKELLLYLETVFGS